MIYLQLWSFLKIGFFQLRRHHHGSGDQRRGAALRLDDLGEVMDIVAIAGDDARVSGGSNCATFVGLAPQASQFLAASLGGNGSLPHAVLC